MTLRSIGVVTAEQAAEAAVRDRGSLIQAMLGAVADGISTSQANGGIIERANLAAEGMFGPASDGLLGQNFSELTLELDRDQRNGSIECYRASDEARAAGLASDAREVIARAQAPRRNDPACSRPRACARSENAPASGRPTMPPFGFCLLEDPGIGLNARG